MFNDKKVVQKILNKAGIEINGTRSWDIQVHDERLYRRLLIYGSLGLGESYMDKWWDCERIDLFIEKILRSKQFTNTMTLPLVLLKTKAFFLNLQSEIRTRKAIEQHYDLGNDLYMTFLDPYNQYTCGYFKETTNLNEAQEKKLELICRKLKLKSSDRVLDVGCGWGGFAKYAARKYGCKVVGITISNEQLKYAKEYTTGLSVEIRKQDYRDLAGEKFDKIVNVGMMEHVGYKNYKRLMKIIESSLQENGIFLLQTIGQNFTSVNGNPWSDKYIFPNGMLPSAKQIAKASEGVFIIEDWHNFGSYYHNTLCAWDDNFQKNWPKIKDKYSETFYRMFRYYFNSFAGAFSARRIQLYQIVFSKGASDQVYESVR